MSEAVLKLIPLLDAITPDERATVTDYLNGLEEDISSEEWEEAWANEVNRRIADYEAGKTKLIPADEVMKRLKEKYG
jgi:putative addiction module component (TIGR02574 family)